MSHVKTLLVILLLLSFSRSYALIISDVIPFNNQLGERNSFIFDMVSQGYNPHTDVIRWVTFEYDIKEIVEDPFEDTGEMEDVREFIIIYDRFLYTRQVFADMDTGVFREHIDWLRMEECRYGDGAEECYFQPDQDGFFYSYWEVSTDNLWLNSISLTIDVDRTEVPEPPAIFLLLGLIPLLLRHAVRLKA